MRRGVGWGIRGLECWSGEEVIQLRLDDGEKFTVLATGNGVLWFGAEAILIVPTTERMLQYLNGNDDQSFHTPSNGDQTLVDTIGNFWKLAILAGKHVLRLACSSRV